jgi:uncharacterized protein (TIGR02594 family)
MIKWVWHKMEALNDELFPSPVPPWIRVAQREIGVKEVRGGENPRILEYHSTTTLKASEDEVAWCSSFVNWVCKKCKLERSHSAAARSWLGYGRRLPGYKKYAIVVFKRGNSSWQGHVGFAMDLKDGYVKCLGGNQGDRVSYANYPASSVLGYLWPLPESAVEVRPQG